MPCHNCHAPDIKNAQANYCFHCGTSLNASVAEKDNSASKAGTILLVFLGLQLFMNLFYYLVPMLLRAMNFDSSFYSQFYKYTNAVYILAEIALMIMAIVMLKKQSLKIFCIVFLFFKVIFLILNFIPYNFY
jgi:hypothetical protein